MNEQIEKKGLPIWNVQKNEVVNGNISWRIQSDKALMVVYAFRDRFEDGIFVENFDNAFDGMVRIIRPEFRELIAQILKCMREVGRRKLYSYPSFSVAKALDKAGAVVATSEKNREITGEALYVVTEKQLEDAYQKFKEKNVRE